MNPDRIVETLALARQSGDWQDDLWDAEALAPTVEALIREAVREALTEAAALLPPLEEFGVLTYRDEHYPEP